MYIFQARLKQYARRSEAVITSFSRFSKNRTSFICEASKGTHAGRITLKASYAPFRAGMAAARRCRVLGLRRE